MADLAAVAAVGVTLYAAHQVADHWIQTDRQAARKGLPGWSGRVACAGHVATYTLTSLVALAVLAAVTGWRPGTWPLIAGLAVSAATHYFADRREPLRRLASWLPSTRGLVHLGHGHGCLGTGAYVLDQSWHIGWLWVSVLIISV